MNFQDLTHGISTEHVIEGVIVGTVIAASKVYDILRGRSEKSSRESDHSDIVRRFEEHAASDNLAFQEIATGHATVIERLDGINEKVDDVKNSVAGLETRERDRLERAAQPRPYTPGSGFPPPNDRRE